MRRLHTHRPHRIDYRPILPGLVFIGLFVCYPATLMALPGLTVETEGVTGGFLKVQVAGTYHPTASSAELRSGSGKVIAQNVLFRLPNGNDNQLYALLGVPNSLRTGIYKVTLSSANGSLVESRLITIRSIDYRSETIHLNESLSDLRQTDDPRRMDEAKKLWDLTGQNNTDALYHFGPFGLPLIDGVETSLYGDRRVYRYTDVRSDNSVHTGIDLASPTGTPVLSSGDGRVVLAANRLITGKTVVIEHLPGVYSLYYHLDEIRVEPDTVVSGGDEIGTVGSSGLATGPHLHWEIRIGGVAVDPTFMTDLTF